MVRFVTRSVLMFVIVALLLLNLLQVGVSRHAIDALAAQAEQIRELEKVNDKLKFDADLAKAVSDSRLLDMLIVHHDQMALNDSQGDVYCKCVEVAVNHGIDVYLRAPVVWRAYCRYR